MNTVLLVLMMRILSRFSLENVLSFSIGTLEGEKNLFLTKWLLFLLYLHESKKEKKIPFYQQLSAVLQFFRIKNCGPVLLMCCFYCEWRSVGVLFLWAMCHIHSFIVPLPFNISQLSFKHTLTASGRTCDCHQTGPSRTLTAVKKSEEALDTLGCKPASHLPAGWPGTT